MVRDFWLHAAALAFCVAIATMVGVIVGGKKAANRSGWMRPAEFINERTERFNRPHERITDDGRIVLVWLDADGQWETASTPDLVPAASNAVANAPTASLLE